jgi:opacity protein-like surface antigen
MGKRTLALVVILIIAGATSGFSQGKIEATVFGGWTFADGVNGPSITVPTVGSFDRVDPKDGGLFGLGLGILFSENAEAGFQWTRVSSKLVAGGTFGTQDMDLADMSLHNYHGYLGYNFLEADSKFRPFLYGGLGATHFGSVDARRLGQTVGGNTQFSTTWGAGVKYYPTERIGVRFTTSWTPVYIKSDPAGYWCDPYWGCYTLGDAQYSNQISLTGGLSFRF